MNWPAFGKASKVYPGGPIFRRGTKGRPFFVVFSGCFRVISGLFWQRGDTGNLLGVFVALLVGIRK